MIISSPTVRGSGAISSAFVSPDGSMLAIISTFPLLTNPPGRASYMGQRIRQRLALHRRGQAGPFVVFDGMCLPINDVSFHPFEPVIAVAGGSYDGGWLFEGELVFWDWQADRSWPAVSHLPEIERCQFSADGAQLEILVRPWDEEWAEADDPFDCLYRHSIAYTGADTAPVQQVEIDPAQAIVRQTLGFATPDPAREEALLNQIKEWLAVTELSSRGAIWDVAWLDDTRLAAVHNACLLEIHDVTNGSVISLNEEGLFGASILPTSPPVVCVYDAAGWHIKSSRLLALNHNTLAQIACFAGSYNFTCSSAGLIVGRQDRQRAPDARQDVIVDINTGQVQFANLGHYDCFNHFLGLNGAPDLYILQGTPDTSHEHKRLCRVGADAAVETLWHLLPADGSHASHAMECLGCYVDDQLGAGIVVCGRHYSPDPNKGKQGFIYRRSIQRSGFVDQYVWRHATDSSVSALAPIPEARVIMVAFLDGTLSMLNAETGSLIMSGLATVEGIATVIYSMSARGTSLAVGTFDGRIAVIQIAQLNECVTEGRVELGQALSQR